LTQSGLATSGGEAKRKVAEGAVRINDQPIKDAGYLIAVGDTAVKLSLGKKRHALIVR
jgi:tyrosyl-tRNA synthetase